nr:MAG TPA: Raf-like Ras-binding domain [Caudoviricetes sp.]
MINPQIINQAKSMMNNMNQVKGIMGMLSGKGMNPEQAVRSICQQRGINVDEFMSQLK